MTGIASGSVETVFQISSARRIQPSTLSFRISSKTDVLITKFLNSAHAGHFAEREKVRVDREVDFLRVSVSDGFLRSVTG